MEFPGWIEIIEASIKELLSLERQLHRTIQEDPSISDHQRLWYTRVLIAYHRSQTGELQRWIDELAPSRGEDLLWGTLIDLATMRLHSRSDIRDLTPLRSLLKEVVARDVDDLFKGEACFIAAFALASSQLSLEAEELFKRASLNYEKAGAAKKTLRASLAALAAYSCAYPESRLFYEYTELSEKCLQAKEYVSAATALLNVSREFQRLGAFSAALTYANQAIELFEAHGRGTREHGLTLAHRAHLHFEMNLRSRSERDLIYALTVGNRDVQAACKIVADHLEVNLHELACDRPLPTWDERKERQEKRNPPLSPMESRLLENLSTGPKSKADLMFELYGDRISEDSREGRLKNLLSRVRTRLPGLIYLYEGKYHLSDIAREKL